MAQVRANSIEIRAKFPGPVAEQFYDDRSYVSIIRGPLGSGKTNTVILKILQLASEQEANANGVRPSRLIIIRNHYPDLVTTSVKDWQAITGELAPIKMSHPPSQLLKWKMQDNTIVELDVLFLALDREEDIKKLRGTQSTFVWLNESKELPKAVFDMATRPLGRYPSRALGGVQCTFECLLGDSNSPDEDHWIATLEKSPPEGYSFFVQPGGVIKDKSGQWIVNKNAENIENLPKDYYGKMMRAKGEDWIKVNLANELGTSIDGKPVHPEYSDSVHCKEFEVNPDYTTVFGADFGLTPAIAMGQFIDGTLYIFDEIVTENFSAVELSESLIERTRSQYPQLKLGYGWGDPSGSNRSQADKNTPFSVMQANRLNILPTHTNSFGLRKDALSLRLRTLNRNGTGPSFVIHPRCKIIRKGLSGHYRFKRVAVVGDERFNDVPEKNIYSHVCEALQYLSVGLGDSDRLIGHSSDTDWNVPFLEIISDRRGSSSSRDKTGYRRPKPQSSWNDESSEDIWWEAIPS